MLLSGAKFVEPLVLAVELDAERAFLLHFDAITPAFAVDLKGFLLAPVPISRGKTLQMLISRANFSVYSFKIMSIK